MQLMLGRDFTIAKKMYYDLYPFSQIILLALKDKNRFAESTPLVLCIACFPVSLKNDAWPYWGTTFNNGKMRRFSMLILYDFILFLSLPCSCV